MLYITKYMLFSNIFIYKKKKLFYSNYYPIYKIIKSFYIKKKKNIFFLLNNKDFLHFYFSKQIRSINLINIFYKKWFYLKIKWI